MQLGITKCVLKIILVLYFLPKLPKYLTHSCFCFRYWFQDGDMADAKIGVGPLKSGFNLFLTKQEFWVLSTAIELLMKTATIANININ